MRTMRALSGGFVALVAVVGLLLSPRLHAQNVAPTFNLRPANLQSNLISNGSFETGSFTGWITSDTANNTPEPAVRLTNFNLGFFRVSATDGTNAATHYFSGDHAGTISIAQDVTIPPGGVVTLYFSYKANAITDDTAAGPRTFRVTVQPSGGGAEQFSQTILSVDPDTIYLPSTNTAVTVDLTAFAGQSIRVGFVTDIPADDTGGGAFQLDNVRLAATTPDFIVYENSGTSTTLNFATNIVAGPSPAEDGQVVSFQVNNNNTGLFSSQPAIGVNGTLTFTSATDSNGVATVTVVAQDDGGTGGGGVDTSVTKTFTITVLPVNSAPRLTFNTNNVVVLEDNGAYSASLATITAGPADESAQSVTNAVTSNDNNSLFTAQPAVALNGNLTFTPAANANGVATVTVIVQDNGGTANGGVDKTTNTFTLTVTAVNDAPTLAAIANPAAILEDAGEQTVSLSGISAGPANESAQALTVTATSSNRA